MGLGASLAITVSWLYFVRTPLGIDFAKTVGNSANSVLNGRDHGRVILVNQFPAFIFSFGLGIALASIWAHNQLPKKRRSILAQWPKQFFVLGLFVVVFAMGVLGRYAIRNDFEDVFVLARSSSVQGTVYYYLEHTLMALGFFFLVAGVVFSKHPRRILEWHWMRALGILSYGVFLLHFPVLMGQSNLEWMEQIGPELRFPIAWFFGMSTTIGLAVVLWFAIERPFIALGKRRLRNQTQVTTTLRTES